MKRILLLAVTIAAVLGSGAAAQSGYDLFQQALAKERAEGKLQEAIVLYKRVVTAASGDRALAARALVRMAECHQKLGDRDAQGIYQQILREYADQPEATTVARARLGQQRAAGTGMVARQLWTATGYSQVTITNDGRSAAVMEQTSPDVQIRDFTTGQMTRLKLPLDQVSGAYAEWPVLSPDLKQLAYAFAGPETKWNYQLRIAPALPDAKPRPLGITFPYLYVMGWAADGRAVLVTALGEGNDAQIAWISTIDGSVRTIKSLGWHEAGELSPDGKFIAYAVRLEQSKPDEEIRILAADGSSETVSMPAPGINTSPIWSRDGSHLVFKSNRSGTYGIWSMAVRNGRAEGSPTRLKADTGDIKLIGFNAAGSLLYEHATGTSDVFAMDLDPQTGTVRGAAVRLVDTFLGSNITPAASPDGKSLAYRRRTGAYNQWSNIVVRSLETGSERFIPMIFRYGGTPVWSPDGQRLVQFGRNSEGHTTFYTVDLKSGDVASAFDTERGRHAVSRDGRTGYTWMVAETGPTVVATIDLASGRRANVSLPPVGAVRSLSPSPDGRSLMFIGWESDQPGRAHLYVADADGGNVRAILTSDKPEELPVLASWSPDGRSIYFLQRSRRSLWRVPAAGGAPALVGELAKSSVQTFDVTRDGRRVIFGTDSLPTVEIWALDNVLPPPLTASGRR